jgi:DNA-binding NarL/FixJ family response regulator
LEVLRLLKQARPTLPVLLLSLHPGSQYIKGSLKAGASGFLSKETAPDELRAAIDTVLAGGVYVSRALAGE